MQQPYELLFIVSASFADSEVEAVSSRIQALVTAAGGQLVATENLGKIRLAYPIKKAHHGTYLLCYFDAEPSAIAALNRQLQLSDDVLRHTILARPTGAEKRKFQITSYVAPLSEEAREQSRAVRPVSPIRPMTAPVAAVPVETPMRVAEASMSMEELDKKLDEILKEDLKA